SRPPHSQQTTCSPIDSIPYLLREPRRVGLDLMLTRLRPDNHWSRRLFFSRELVPYSLISSSTHWSRRLPTALCCGSGEGNARRRDDDARATISLTSSSSSPNSWRMI